MAFIELRAAAQQALEALESGADSWQRVGPAIDALKEALAEPVQEPKPVAQRGAMFHTHPAVERQRSVEAAVRPACGVDPAAKAETVQEPRTIRMERVDRSTSQHWWSEAARIRMPSPELYAAGDTVLCWVNEGDMVRAAQPKAEPVQEPEPVATMTVREDIIRMAREVGLKVCTNISGVTLVGAPLGDTPSIAHITIDEMARLTALVVAAERERNAKIADAHASCEGIAQVIAAEIRGQA